MNFRNAQVKPEQSGEMILTGDQNISDNSLNFRLKVLFSLSHSVQNLKEISFIGYGLIV